MLPPACPHLRLAGALALALAIAGMTLLPVARVSANGPHQEVFAGPVGPYDLTVSATSVAGSCTPATANRATGPPAWGTAPLGDKLSVEEIWHLINYLKTLE